MTYKHFARDKAMSSIEPVIRFCPHCGTKAKATKESFSTPQTCPTCKQKVLFWDVTKEPAGNIVEAINLKPIIPPQAILILVAFSLAIVLFTFFLFLLGYFGLPVTVAILLLLAGAYGVAIFFAQQYKVAKQSEIIRQLMSTLEATRDQQIGISIKYASLQENFQTLTDIANREAFLAKARYESSLEYELEKLKKRESEATEIVRAIAIKYLDETQKTLIAKLNTENLSQTQDRFRKAIDFCGKVGYRVPQTDVDRFLSEIKSEYSNEVKKQLAREEQARIKEKLREEAKAEAEFQREMKRLEQEEKLLERLLAEARAKATAESSAQIEDLERRLAEAKDKERSLSMAQQTKAGNVYVISNIGSFGEGVFKIGMTRRLEPLERVKELGDASVPFPFDVHMMIGCDNAPTMENELHKRFNKYRLNRVNFRKEFFRVDLEEIRKAVTELHGEVEYVATPDALQYRESLSMTDEEFELISNVSQDAGMDDDDDDAT